MHVYVHIFIYVCTYFYINVAVDLVRACTKLNEVPSFVVLFSFWSTIITTNRFYIHTYIYKCQCVCIH